MFEQDGGREWRQSPKQAVVYEDARVQTPEGDEGRVRHVIVDPQTREVIDLVIAAHGHDWLLPLTDVVSIVDDTIILPQPVADCPGVSPFDPHAYRAVQPEEARSQTQERAEHGGAPLLNAREDAVVVDAAVFPGAEQPLPEVEPPVALAVEPPAAAPAAPAPLPAAMAAAAAAVEPESAAPVDPHAPALPYHIQLTEERPRVLREMEQAGAVRVSRRIVERKQTLEVTIREEVVTIEHLGRTERPITVGDKDLHAGESIDVTLKTEKVEVHKEPVVIGDVRLRKEALKHEEPMQVTLRREELVIDGQQELVTGDLGPTAPAEAGAGDAATGGS